MSTFREKSVRMHFTAKHTLGFGALKFPIISYLFFNQRCLSSWIEHFFSKKEQAKVTKASRTRERKHHLEKPGRKSCGCQVFSLNF